MTTRKTTQSKGELAAQASKAVQKEERPERMSLRADRNMLYEKFRTNFRLLVASDPKNGVELARDMRMESGKHIYYLCSGRRTPDIAELIVIANYFKVTMDDLMSRNGKIVFEP